MLFRRIEHFLHMGPFVYSTFYGLYALSNQYFNPYTKVCIVAILPWVAVRYRSKSLMHAWRRSPKVFQIFLMYPAVIVFIMICSIMTFIVHLAKKI